MHEIPNEVVHLTVITGRKQKDELLDAMIEMGCKFIHVTFGRGSVKSGYLKDMLGLVHEEQKAIITCLLAKQRADQVLKKLSEEFDFDQKNTGIAFTVPVQKISF